MSVLKIGGQRFAAGLDWMDGTGSEAVARAAAEADRPWVVFVGGQTGLAPADGNPEGAAALAAALRKLLARETAWMALVGEGEGPWAVVRQVDGHLLADGDRVHATLDEALKTFGDARARAGVLAASPGLLPDDPDVRALDHKALAAVEGLAKVVAAPPPPRSGKGKLLRSLAAVAALIAIGGGGFHLWPEISGLWKEKPKEAPPVAMIGTATDADAFLAGCAAAWERVLLHLGAWEARDLVCYARFLHGEIVQVHPGLRGRPALLATWQLTPGLDVQAHRRLAEGALGGASGWDRFQVGADTAWAVAVLPSAVRKFRQPPSYPQFRAAVDREFGLRGLAVIHGEAPPHPAGDATVTATGRLRVAALREIVSAVPGLEAVQVAEVGEGLRLVARKEREEFLSEPVFEELQRGSGS